MIATFFIFWAVTLTTLIILNKRLNAEFKKELEEEEI